MKSPVWKNGLKGKFIRFICLNSNLFMMENKHIWSIKCSQLILNCPLYKFVLQQQHQIWSTVHGEKIAILIHHKFYEYHLKIGNNNEINKKKHIDNHKV